ncbi:MAG: hypothetical protein RJA70_2379 [Pseudomonadota bacterium]|jgi:LAO/AO transport system kinase
MVHELPSEAPEDALRKLKSGDRRLLARCLTLAESRRADHAAWLSELLALGQGSPVPQYRVAFSGAPGAGKSSLVDVLGEHAIDQGYRLAVLAVDPSSETSGGSLLADKTRMTRLSADPRSFVRPSPNRTQLGGVTDALLDQTELCALAGFDLVFIETVGVGQAEVDARDCSDSFVLLLTPGSGDELQGLKRGITEAADWLVINKADTDPTGAERVRQAYAAALSLLRPEGETPIAVVSAQTGEGIEELWAPLERRIRSALETERIGGKLGESAGAKQARVFRRLARREIVRRIEARSELQAALQRLEREISAGERTLRAALLQVARLLDEGP